MLKRYTRVILAITITAIASTGCSETAKTYDIDWQVGTRITGTFKETSIRKAMRWVEGSEPVEAYGYNAVTEESVQEPLIVNKTVTSSTTLLSIEEITGKLLAKESAASVDQRWESYGYLTRITHEIDMVAEEIETLVNYQDSNDSRDEIERTTEEFHDQLALYKYFIDPDLEGGGATIDFEGPRSRAIIAEHLSGDAFSILEKIIGPVSWIQGLIDLEVGEIYIVDRRVVFNAISSEKLTIGNREITATKVLVQIVEDNSDKNMGNLADRAPADSCLRELIQENIDSQNPEDIEIAEEIADTYCPAFEHVTELWFHNGILVKAMSSQRRLSTNKIFLITVSSPTGDYCDTQDSGIGYEIIRECDRDGNDTSSDECRYRSKDRFGVGSTYGGGSGCDLKLDFENRDANLYMHYWDETVTQEWMVDSIE